MRLSDLPLLAALLALMITGGWRATKEGLTAVPTILLSAGLITLGVVIALEVRRKDDDE